MKLSGGCHCGGVRFSFTAPESTEMLDCNCSICARSGYLHLFIPHEDFILETGGDALKSYRFGSGEAEHLFCSTCGIKSFYQPRSHPHDWSVNAHCLDSAIPEGFTIKKFDGRNWEEAHAQISDE